jgi:hypothetical protein
MRMRNRLLGALTLALLLLGMVATVGVADPGPNGKNDKGLCTAYFNGQKKGHDKQKDENGAYPGPFGPLEDVSRDYAEEDGRDNDRDGNIDEEGEGDKITAAEAIFNYCDDNAEILGNPDHGRWDCDRDPAADSDPDCERNPAPGNSGTNGSDD